MGFIYMITCSVNGKVYIGQTRTTVEERFKKHLSSARYYSQTLTTGKKWVGCTKLCRAINRHGEGAFSIETLVQINDLELDVMEGKFITVYNSVADGYNIRPGGVSSPMDESTKSKLREIATERIQTTFTQFRKYDELLGELPIHCVHLRKQDREGVAIRYHPLCAHKSFMVETYGSMENAKQALLVFLADLESSEVAVPARTKDSDLPRGIYKPKKCDKAYIVRRCINGVRHTRTFQRLSDEENKQNAINYLKSLTEMGVQAQ